MEYEKLVEIAKEARENSYSPFSNFKVGAALLTKSGNVYKGCNVENSAYGPSNCAERTAVFSAVANGERDFVAIAIVGGDCQDYCYPCGVCRQVLVEFNPDIDVIVSNGKNEILVHKIKDLLPNYFRFEK